MKVIIAGSRILKKYDTVKEAIEKSGFEITEVVSGGNRSHDPVTHLCYGADYYGECWAEENKVPVKRFPPNWDLYGKAAGPIRNREMAEYADAVIAIRINKSRGTSNMIEEAQKKNLKIFVLDIEIAPRIAGG
jgi:hypothetical protein